uniref:Uncharacterized protein n=1 Tax=Anguilla anguilla TaxID=7936 RepID=A0A0E9UIA3_ANGAN
MRKGEREIGKRAKDKERGFGAGGR